ncbi:hypothetical protein [Cellulomonas sp. RIT-PI-Y]|uniref:hypothetical protein n=1 Tax=Cellulomonas sp. RIT-PI-Y TaxID=3035297 RepID=UPI0021DAC257|nr:hypothetical protein [Cellulomonas sp. RIT-PI-Y]
MNCLALTGSNPVPLVVIAVVMIAVATAMIVIARRARARRRAGVALTLLIALTVTMTAGLTMTGAGGAQAASGDGCDTGASGSATTATTTAEPAPTTPSEPATSTDPATPGDPATPSDPTTPVDPTDPTTPVDPTDPTTPTEPTDPTVPVDPVDPEPEPDPEPEEPVVPAVVDYVPSFAADTATQPTGYATGDTQHELTLTNSGDGDGTEPIVLLIADQANGYWDVTGLLDADGIPAADVTMSHADGITRFEIATPLTAGASRTFLLSLHHPALGYGQRPASVVTVQISDDVTDADHTNNSASFSFIPSGSWGPPDEE